ncbi:kinase-like domain-containing protein [Polychytrium aggregatum]|uniref:kinase-like domain-containing protein n=1 Tax=Polychytrium aggregatum TaxID=110093 RepID=UPI0022FE4F93|nr:kinase-like domain-containing protein [Polychytrium aggregatum]KAI9199495.1 kinase-like domain-containing protein [Polychytrium aggregatum]
MASLHILNIRRNSSSYETLLDSDRQSVRSLESSVRASCVSSDSEQTLHADSVGRSRPDLKRIGFGSQYVPLAGGNLAAGIRSGNTDSLWKSWIPPVLKEARFVFGDTLASGPSANVYKALDRVSGETVAIKLVRKGKRDARVLREMFILNELHEVPGVVGFAGAFQEPEPKLFAGPAKWSGLVLEYSERLPWSYLNAQIDLAGIQRYVHQLLSSLSHVHSMGIMHRDIKPQALLYNPTTRMLLITDWGHADFVVPGKRYPTQGVSSAHNMPPEYFLDVEHYTSSVDLWAVGCVLGSLLFRTSTFFKGETPEVQEQFNVIVRTLGGVDLVAYCKRASIPAFKAERLLYDPIDTYHRQAWQDRVTPLNQSRITPEGLDLLNQLLCYDPDLRPTAAEALRHPFFGSLSTAN